MKVDWQFDDAGFKAMCAGLADMSQGRVSYTEALLDQTGKVLEVAMRYTNASSVEVAENRGRRRWGKRHRVVDGDQIVSVNSGGRGAPAGRTWFIQGRRKYIMSGPYSGGDKRRWSNVRWARYLATKSLLPSEGRSLKEEISISKRARGLLKKSWLNIAKRLGIPIDAPGYVRNARPDNNDGDGQVRVEAEAIFVEIINSNPILCEGKRVDGRDILQRAVYARLAAFSIDMEKGVFEDLKRRAERYPGIFVS